MERKISGNEEKKRKTTFNAKRETEEKIKINNRFENSKNFSEKNKMMKLRNVEEKNVEENSIEQAHAERCKASDNNYTKRPQRRINVILRRKSEIFSINFDYYKYSSRYKKEIPIYRKIKNAKDMKNPHLKDDKPREMPKFLNQRPPTHGTPQIPLSQDVSIPCEQSNPILEKPATQPRPSTSDPYPPETNSEMIQIRRKQNSKKVNPSNDKNKDKLSSDFENLGVLTLKLNKESRKLLERSRSRGVKEIIGKEELKNPKNARRISRFSTAEKRFKVKIDQEKRVTKDSNKSPCDPQKNYFCSICKSGPHSDSPVYCYKHKKVICRNCIFLKCNSCRNAICAECILNYPNSFECRRCKNSCCPDCVNKCKFCAKVYAFNSNPIKPSNNPHPVLYNVNPSKNNSIPKKMDEPKGKIAKIPYYPSMGKYEEQIYMIAELFEKRKYVFDIYQADQMTSTLSLFQKENMGKRRYNEYFFILKFYYPGTELRNFEETEAKREICDRLYSALLLPAKSLVKIKLENNFQEICFTINSYIWDYPLSIENITRLPYWFPQMSQLEIKSKFSDKSVISEHLNPSFDYDYTNKKSSKVQYRGNMPYYEPIGWKAIALNVIGKEKESKILACNNSPDEWAVGFHGTKIEYLPSIILNGLIPGQNQAYRKTTDINDLSENIGNTCGVGVYFCSNIEGCTSYCREFTLNSRTGPQKTIIAFQCRLNPRKIRIPETKPDIMIVRETEDILPYRMMIKIL